MVTLDENRNKLSVIIFLFIFALVIWWMIQIGQGKVPCIDQWSRGLVNVVAHTPIFTFFRWVTELGSKTFTIPFTITMSLVLWRLYRNWFPALLYGLGTWSTHLLNQGLKSLIVRERPSISELLNAQGYSFPSGHAMISMVCYGLLGFLLIGKIRSKRAKKYMRIFFVLLIILIGTSRYFINVHYITDVVAGYFFGYLWLRLLMYIFNKKMGKKHQ